MHINPANTNANIHWAISFLLIFAAVQGTTSIYTSWNGNRLVVTSHKQFCGAFLITSCYVIASVICHRTVIDEQNSLVTFVLKNVSVWIEYNKDALAKLLELFFMYMETYI